MGIRIYKYLHNSSGKHEYELLTLTEKQQKASPIGLLWIIWFKAKNMLVTFKFLRSHITFWKRTWHLHPHIKTLHRPETWHVFVKWVYIWTCFSWKREPVLSWGKATRTLMHEERMAVQKQKGGTAWLRVWGGHFKAYWIVTNCPGHASGLQISGTEV